MCAVSMVGDHYSAKWHESPWAQPNISAVGTWRPAPDQAVPFVGVSQDEFNALKRDVEEMKALLLRAKEYDERNGEPACEMEEKVALLRKVAALVGVDLSDVFGGVK